ncbi:MAG: AAA family ATPase [Thermoplasmatales archaeon]|nr:AAA family ATPase [Thermoplasmatales archaeon]MCW6169972.1 AAA family ATPase [Thermoplasmatales archaeon]
MKPTNRKLVRLLIEDFGPIERADLELGDFTAIIGPNSSGKTFIINLVDRLMAFASTTYMFTISNIVFRGVEEILVKKENKGYPISINMSEYPEDDINQVVDYVIENLGKIGNQQNIGLGNVYGQLFRYFQTDPKNLIRFGRDRARITAYFEQMKINITISHDKGPSIEFLPYREFLINYVKGFTVNFMGSGGGSYGSSFQSQQLRSVLIPTERLSVLVTMPNIIEDLAKSRGLQNLFPILPQAQPNQASKLSLIEFMSNYLGAIQFITTSKKEISRNASDLIMGNLTLDFNLPFFINFRLGENSLPLHLISSGTLQLIPLVVLAESDLNNALLIEEPEINLHANKQVEVAEYLWNLVEERNKTILVSTHSDYFVMRLAHLSKDNKSKILRVYLLNEGRTTPLNINKKGEIEEIVTIGRVMNKLLLET